MLQATAAAAIVSASVRLALFLFLGARPLCQRGQERDV